MKNFFLKGMKFCYGFVLYHAYTRWIDFNQIIKGKKVAIIGAANSAYNTGAGNYIDDFDFVIRVNKAPHLLKDKKWSIDIGVKADILFHSFYENDKSGGGTLDLKLYDELQIKYIINPIPSFKGRRVTFNFYKKYLAKKTVFHLKGNSYYETLRELKGFEPTIGFCALKEALSSEFTQLYISGFTFFKTAFGEGYRDQMKEAHEVQKYLKDAGLHNPDLEFRYFLKLLAENKHKTIAMDDTLMGIIRQHQNSENLHQ
jgi:hypothetical protein